MVIKHRINKKKKVIKMVGCEPWGLLNIALGLFEISEEADQFRSDAETYVALFVNAPRL